MREGWEGGMGGDGSEREGRGGMRGRVGWKDGREGGKERGRERERRGGRRQGRRGGRKGGRRISGWVVVISSTFTAAPLMLVSFPDPLQPSKRVWERDKTQHTIYGRSVVTTLNLRCNYV